MAAEKEVHEQSYGHLALVLGGLLCLTVVTVAAARVAPGPIRIWTALLIAASKATLVLLFFMHLRRAGRAVVVTFLATIGILAVSMAFIFWDIAFR